MRGSIRKRGETWTVYWSINDSDGKRQQRTRGGFRTRKDAQSHLTETLAALQNGGYAEPSRVTLKEFLEVQWLPSIRASVRHSTFDSYERNIRLHVLPRLGGIRLQQLSPDQLNTFYGRLLTEGRLDGKDGGLSVKTVRYLHTIVHKALKDAVRWGKIVRNPAASAEPPKLSAARKREMQTWSATEVRSFLTSVSGDRLYGAWVLAATTGLRRGEVLGLRWVDVDLDNSRVHIRQNLTSVAYKIQFSEPKTNRSARVVQLDPNTVAALKSHRAQQAQERLAWGPAYQDSGLVFTRENGELVHPDRFTQMFDLHVKRSGLPTIRLHDLRHTHATLALQAGVPAKIVSDRLGHSTVAFTQDVYTHAIPTMQADAAERIAALVFGPTGS